MTPYQAVQSLLLTLSKEELSSLTIPSLLDDISTKETLGMLIQQHWHQHYQNEPDKPVGEAYEIVLYEAEVRYGLKFNTVSGRYEDGE